MKKQISTFLLIIVTSFFAYLGHPLPSYGQLNMLVYGDTSPGIANSAPGFNVTVWDDATWAAASTADFAAFNVIVFADAPLPSCITSSSVWSTAIATQAAWGPAITGNVLIIGSDPDFHITYSGVSSNVEYNFLNYAASGNGTGLFVALSCVYNGVAKGTAVPLLNPLGTFTVEGAAAGGYNESHIVANSPALTGVTDAMLSNWDFSVHEGFDVWPTNFIPLAIATDATDPNYTAEDGTTGLVYILATGSIVGLGTNTPTPLPTWTPTSTPSATGTFTPTFSPTNTTTLTPIFTPTQTPTITPTFTPTPTTSWTPSQTTTQTPTVTPTFTPTCETHIWPDPYNSQYAVGQMLNISCLPSNATVYFYTLSGELVGQATEWQGLAQWNGKNQRGVPVSAGIYFYVIKNGQQKVIGTGKFLVSH